MTHGTSHRPTPAWKPGFTQAEVNGRVPDIGNQVGNVTGSGTTFRDLRVIGTAAPESYVAGDRNQIFQKSSESLGRG